IIQSFGDQVSLHGGLPRIANGLSRAVVSPKRGQLTGAGFIMEGMGYNPVVYDLMGQMLWQPMKPDLDRWIAAYAHRRYGARHPKAEEAWRILLNTAYRLSRQRNSVICGRPTLNASARHAGGGDPYPPSELARAAELLAECAPEFAHVDAYQYDLVHVTRQVLTTIAARRQHGLAVAYRTGNRAELAAAGQRYLDLMNDMDTLLGTRPEFLLGRWLNDAKHWATTPEEAGLYEWNARTQITQWSPKEGPLFDYASKQWSGLIQGFYVPRWQQLIDALDQSLADGTEFDPGAFDRHMRDWEEAWTHQTETYPDEPDGDPAEIAQRLLDTHVDEIGKPEVSNLTTGKPVTCSHALPEYPARLANDGYLSNTDAYWATDTGVDKACWWQVDLEEPTEIARVVAILYYGDSRRYEFYIETSLDGETWDMAADYRDDPQPSRREGVVATFEPRRARYLRVTVTHNSANTGRHLVEVLAYPGDTPTLGPVKLLSEHGSTRATRYATANKIVTLDGKTHVAWLDSISQTMVATYDHAADTWSDKVKVGDGADNHGGPALTCDGEGRLHIIFGPHAGPFQHCRSVRPNDASEWERLPEFGDHATYPSVVCDKNDTLHIIYRGRTEPRHLLYQRLPKGGAWTEPRSLCHADLEKGYTHYHSSLAIADDDTLHIAYDIYGAKSGPAQCAGHLMSRDLGDTWTLADGNAVEVPTTPASDAFFRRTTESLSMVGMVCDADGHPWVTLTAGKDGPELWRHDGEAWRCAELDKLLPEGMDGSQLGLLSPPTFDDHGGLYIMAGLAGDGILLHSRDEGAHFSIVPVLPKDAALPHTGFSTERPTGHHTVANPWLLFSTGEKGPDCFGEGIYHSVRAAKVRR
ncbi:MAG: hypothetical protein GY851_00125, partial [bacterium]|nr:hypothetical protein [bacterium]